MAREILFTRPLFDDVTNHFFYWTKKVLEYLDSRKISYVNIEGNQVKKRVFTSYMKKLKPKLVFLNGHGNSDVVAGQNNKPILIYKDNDHLTTKSIV